MGKVSYTVKDQELNLAVDLNEDGEPSVEMKLNINEGIQEAMRTGKPVEGVKVASMKFEGTKLVLVLDTDQDGEPVASMKIDMIESIDEAKDLVL